MTKMKAYKFLVICVGLISLFFYYSEVLAVQSDKIVEMGCMSETQLQLSTNKVEQAIGPW